MATCSSGGRVGILTFHRGPNHGGYLQVSELVSAVASLGHDVEVINYQNPRHQQAERFRPWLYRRPSSLSHAWKKHRVFRKALRRLPLGPFTTHEADLDWNRYATVIVGADVVWDFESPGFGNDAVYFGSFRQRFSGRLASYAPSCGSASPAGVIPSSVRDGLAGFDKVSVRDETTAELVRTCTGREATVVVDPTWLPLRGQEAVDSNAGTKPGGYLAVYCHTIDRETATEIRRYARDRGLRIVACGYRQSWADRCESSLSPEQWVDFLRGAEAVFCGTFHGALYAMRLGKRFAVLPNGRIQAKLATPMKMAGLEDHWVERPADLAELLDLEYDHSLALRRLKPLVERSWDYLVDVVSASERPGTGLGKPAVVVS